MIPIIFCPYPFPIFTSTKLSNWEDALKFFKECHDQVLKRFKDTDIPNADILTAKKSDKVVTLKYAIYYKEDDKWIEESSKGEILAEKIPEDIRKKIDDTQDEVDITEEIERELAARENSAVADE